MTHDTKSGTSSLLLDGSHDRLTLADDWTIGSGDFVIEVWLPVSVVRKLDDAIA